MLRERTTAYKVARMPGAMAPSRLGILAAIEFIVRGCPVKRFVMALAICCGLAGLVTAATVHYKFSLAGNYPGASETGPLAVNSTQIVGYYLTESSSPSYLQTLRDGAASTPFLTI